MEKFSYETNGYNRREVNNFVNEVITQTEGIVKKCKENLCFRGVSSHQTEVFCFFFGK